MKYMIHACKQRMWYVNDFLIPSLIEQGIDQDNITVWLDSDEVGCLESCMRAFESVPDNDFGIWHLQDDIVIDNAFRMFTEVLPTYMKDRIICGYCYSKDPNKDFVYDVSVKNMWFSFPCIYIPNRCARLCADWFRNVVLKDRQFGTYVRSKKHDDTLFHIFMEDYLPHVGAWNLLPNIVDHVDYLIGGSVINHSRNEKETRAVYFTDFNAINKLKERLKSVDKHCST